MGLYRYTVREDGVVVGQRKSPRTYTHAVVVDSTKTSRGDRRFVLAYAGSHALALKAAGGRRPNYYGNPAVVAVEVEEIMRRVRVRCSGERLERRAGRMDGEPDWLRPVRCLKDARDGSERCAEHAETDNAAVFAEAKRSQAANTEWFNARWRAMHEANVSAAACIVDKCPVHAAPTGSA